MIESIDITFMNYGKCNSRTKQDCRALNNFSDDSHIPSGNATWRLISSSLCDNDGIISHESIDIVISVVHFYLRVIEICNNGYDFCFVSVHLPGEHVKTLDIPNANLAKLHHLSIAKWLFLVSNVCELG